MQSIYLCKWQCDYIFVPRKFLDGLSLRFLGAERAGKCTRREFSESVMAMSSQLVNPKEDDE